VQFSELIEKFRDKPDTVRHVTRGPPASGGGKPWGKATAKAKAASAKIGVGPRVIVTRHTAFKQALQALNMRLSAHRRGDHAGEQKGNYSQEVVCRVRDVGTDARWTCPVAKCKGGLSSDDFSIFSVVKRNLAISEHRAKKHPKISKKDYRALIRKENYTHGGNKIGAKRQAGVLGRLFLAQKASSGAGLHRMRTHLMPVVIDRRKASGAKTGERALSLKMRKYCEKCFTTWGSADSFIKAVAERCPGPRGGGVGAVAQDAT
jgi:hypothetical protein